MNRLVKESLHKSALIRNHATINEISEVFYTFYKDIREIMPFLNDETVNYLLEAKELLDKAWENETEDHGVEFTKMEF